MKNTKRLPLILLSVLSVAVHAQNIRFSEVMPSNLTTFQDEDREFPDWFEIYNNSDHEIHLKDYRVSDDEDFENAWVFPDYELEPNQYLLIFASGKDKKPPQTYWETVIEEGDAWKYKLPTQNIPNWYVADFDDSNWQFGESGFGYSDNDDATQVAQTPSIYLRKTFQLSDVDHIVSGVLHVDYDDGFIAYLNGSEIARSENIENPGQVANYNDFTSVDHEARMYQGGFPEKFELSNFQHLLQEGENVLAVEVHNVNATSSDMSIIPFLSFGRDHEPQEYDTSDFLELNKNLHTNFKLDTDGDSLFLFSPEGELVDRLVIPATGTDISIGYKNDDFENLLFFNQSTPGTANTSEGLASSESLVVTFDQPGGTFSGNVTVSLSAPNVDDKIYYTTDGTAPTTESSLYAEPLQLSQPTSIRARIIKDGFLPGKIATQSYYPNYHEDLPVVFFSTDPKNLWDHHTGIYVKGPNAEENDPYFGANFWQDWEKPATVELYIPEEDKSFNIDGGIKIFGAYSRARDQKSLSFFARKTYGEGSIDCELFIDRPFNKYESIIFRNSGNDWHGSGFESGSMVRDLVMSKLVSKMQVEAQAGRPVIVYLNGEYWGIQNMREKINEHFLASHKKEDPDKMDILTNNREVVEGTAENYNNVLNYIAGRSLANDEYYEHVCQLIDVPDYIRYVVAQVFFVNDDWPGNNVKFWRPQRTNGKWRWIFYDSDFGLGLWNTQKVYHNTLEFATLPDGTAWPNPAWATFLFRKLLESKKFEDEFINTFADHLNTTFLPEQVKSFIDYQTELIANEMPDHISKWGGNLNTWEYNNSQMKQFVEIRPGVMKNQLVDFFNLNGTQNISLTISGCESATIRVNSIRVKNFPWGGTYFNNVPIKLTAIPPAGYRFKEWQGLGSSQASITVNMTSNRTITAVFEAYQPEENEGIEINEISYHSADEANSEDWVELYNNSENYVDISNWTLGDSNEENEYRFEENTILAPHEYLVAARDLEDFSEVFPMIKNITGRIGFGFSSAGECIHLYNAEGNLVDEVCYANEYPWPDGADGGGYTLALSSPELDNSIGANWNNSMYLYGTPGGNNSWPTGNETLSAKDETLSIDCYPNPATENVFINIETSSSEISQIDVLNPSGQVLKTLFSNMRISENQSLRWNCTDVAPGLYLIRVQTATDSKIVKVMKVNR